MPGHGGRAAVVVKMTFQGVSPDCAPQRRVFVQVCGERGDQPRAEDSAAGLEKDTKERNGGLETRLHLPGNQKSGHSLSHAVCLWGLDSAFPSTPRSAHPSNPEEQSARRESTGHEREKLTKSVAFFGKVMRDFEMEK